MCSIPSVIKEMQMKITVGYHVTSLMIGIFKKKEKKCWQGHGETVTLVHCQWEYSRAQPRWKTVQQFQIVKQSYKVIAILLLCTQNN